MSRKQIEINRYSILLLATTSDSDSTDKKQHIAAVYLKQHTAFQRDNFFSPRKGALLTRSRAGML